MPRSHWLPVIAVVGLALASAANSQAISHNASGHPSARQAQTKPKTDAPPSVPVAVQNDIERIASALESANKKQPSAAEQQQATDNLEAQQGMAKWARWMFRAAVLEALITAAGVLLVYRTLYHTREATIAAGEAAKAAKEAIGMERAWITLGGFDCGHIPAEKTIEPSRGIPGFGYIVTWKNTGRTPALRLTCYTDYRIVFPPEIIPTFEANEPPTGGLKSVPLGPGDTIRTIPNQLRLDDVEMLAHLVVYSRVEYYDLTSNVMRISEICSRVETTPQMRPDGTIGGGFALVPVGRQNTAS